MIAAPIVTADLTSASPSLRLDVRGLAAVGVQLTGTWTGTVTFEATIDGATWVSQIMIPSTGLCAAGVTTATGNGAWTASVAGYRFVRARFSTPTSGTVVASLLGTNAVARC